jgi:hypothetical protein
MSKTKILPIGRLLSRSEVEKVIGPQIFKDALLAGWIRPRVSKLGRGKRTDIYALSDVREVEERILGGQYPGQNGQTDI